VARESRVSRRRFVRGALAVTAAVAAGNALAGCGGRPSAAPSAAPPAGSPRASGNRIKIGFIPLTDCASVVMAHELGLYAKHGVDVELSKEASWAAVRDKLLSGDLQAAHCLFGMPFSVYTGVGGTAGRELPIAMMLNVNGQAITLPKHLCGAVGFKQVQLVRAGIEQLRASKPEVTFAMTFPGGTHDLWLRYWLAAAGIDQSTVKIITIPPPQMVANMKVGNMDGFCVGEPWGGVAVQEGIGYTHVTTQDIWRHHPEKALVLNKDFNDQHDAEVRAVMRAVLEASIWLDDLDNRARAAEVIAQQAYVNAPASVIAARLRGQYDLGCAPEQYTYRDDYMLFHHDGLVNFPRKAHGIWFLAQYVRFGYLREPPDYSQIVDRLIYQQRYREVAADLGVRVPDDDMRPFTIQLDQVTFDPNDPAGSLRAYQRTAT